MIRLLFWVLLGGLIYFALRKKWRNTIAPAQRDSRPESTSVLDQSGAEKMLVCAHCAVYFPASEAVIVHGKDNQQQVFCSQEHQHLHTGE